MVPMGERPFAAGLILATAIAGALRFWALDAVPIAVYCDEAFLGYEAYSLLLTGKDSRGVHWPLFFDVFGEGWAEPLYVYLSLPAIGILGLTTVATRFAAAAAGTLAVPITGLMTAALLDPGGSTGGSGHSAGIGRRAGLAAAALTALSPWSFHFSRVAFQASLLPVALATGFWLAARALATCPGPGPGRVARGAAPEASSRRDGIRPWMLSSAAGLLALSLYTYTAARVLAPLLLAAFCWIYRRRLRGHARASLAAGLVFASVSSPVVAFSLTEQGWQRAGRVSIFRRADVRGQGLPKAATEVGANYLSYYSPAFLLTEGDPNPRHSVPGHGVLHPHDVILLALGVAGCLAARARGCRFLLWWLLAFPAAAALTLDQRHAIRAIGGQPGVYALAGCGVALLASLGSAAVAASPRPRRLLWTAALIAAASAGAVSTGQYFHRYFTTYRIESAPWWQYGLRQVYERLERTAPDAKVYVQRMTDQPQSQLLFYTAFPPDEYQEHKLARTRWVFNYAGGAVPERPWPVFLLQARVPPPAGARVREVVPFPNGTSAYVIAW